MSLLRFDSHRIIAWAVSGLALLFPVVLACCGASDSLPGTSLGTYSVKGSVSTNTCGASLGATDPYEFDALLSKDGTTLYWKYSDQSSYVSGTLDSSNNSTIAVTTQAATDDSGTCIMSRTDTLVITLNSGTSPSAFTGTLSYAFSVANSSDCSSQLSASGGSYQTLPCTVTYALTATKK